MLLELLSSVLDAEFSKNLWSSIELLAKEVAACKAKLSRFSISIRDLGMLNMTRYINDVILRFDCFLAGLFNPVLVNSLVNLFSPNLAPVLDAETTFTAIRLRSTKSMYLLDLNLVSCLFETGTFSFKLILTVKYTFLSSGVIWLRYGDW